MTTPVAGGWDSDHCLKCGEINDLFDLKNSGIRKYIRRIFPSAHHALLPDPCCDLSLPTNFNDQDSKARCPGWTCHQLLTHLHPIQ
jgi:hypothetical protein